MQTIAERYCAHHGIPPARFERHALRRALPLQGLLLYPFLTLVPGFFAPDLEFIRGVGSGHSLRHFASDAADFRIHPDNSHPARRWLRLRVSSRKLRRCLAAATEAEVPREPHPLRS